MVEDTILDEIEKLRIQMYVVASDRELTDPIVLSISEELDSLINEFYLS
jgi:hypothetical protein